MWRPRSLALSGKSCGRAFCGAPETHKTEDTQDTMWVLCGDKLRVAVACRALGGRAGWRRRGIICRTVCGGCGAGRVSSGYYNRRLSGQGGSRRSDLWNFRHSISAADSWRRVRDEPAPRPLLLVHRAKPANEPGTGECALSQSCGGSALKLSAFAVPEHDAEMRGRPRCTHIKLHLYAHPTDG